MRILSAFVMAAVAVGSLVHAAEPPTDQFARADRANPWYPDKAFPKLITPQWVGEEGVECVVTLGIDDMRDTAKYEQYLRPILNRLKQIDGRAPVSIMTCNVKPEDAQLQSWLEEGLSIEVHTVDHPCPILNGGNFEKAKSTYDRCIDLLHQIPGNKPVCFRTPCCDSLNTVSPRFYSEIFSSATPKGNFLQLDSSVFNFFTSDDKSIPRELVLDKNGNERFRKYLPRNNNYKGLKHDNFVNYIKNYPYPYVINNTCWQFPCVAPSDWSAQHLHGSNNPLTVEDWKAALDITVHKQGVFNLVFHPHGWIKAEQVVELIDHAVEKHGKKVQFLTFRECATRLNEALTGGKPLRHGTDSQKATAAHAEYRRQHPVTGDVRSLPDEIRQLIASGGHEKLKPLLRDDGSHNGVFVHDRNLCWINEDTSHLPDFTYRVSFDELLAARRRRESLRNQPPIPVGAAVVDITPDYPVRLTGYGNRATESDDVAVKIHARALAIGGRADSPLSLLLTVDNCGVPANVTEAVYGRLARKHGLPRERFAICSTHTHSGPWLRGFAPNVLYDLPQQHAEHLAQYEKDLVEKLVAAAEKAIAARRPGRLSIGRGKVGFAINRRVLNNGNWAGFGETADGPVDHQMPILAAHDADGKLIAVLANYACHATTETGSFNKISGDWPGFAADMIEADLTAAGHSDAVALIAIGCGADANPSPRGTHEQAKQHGRAMADEVLRLLNVVKKNVAVTSPVKSSAAQSSLTLRVGSPAGPSSLTLRVGSSAGPTQRVRLRVPEVSLCVTSADETTARSLTSIPAAPHHSESGGYVLQPIDHRLACNMARVNLPLGPLPSRADWETRAQQNNHAGHLAKKFLKMLDDGKNVPTSVPDYPVQTWCFGEDLAMVFLGGEVVVDYSIRLNEMFDDGRLWLNAYANDVPCYIPSKRLLREGGYEVDSSMIFYGHATRLAPEAEDIICDTVQKLVPHEFYSAELQETYPGPMPPKEALASITTRPGFRVELVAAEPLITDPVAFDWDVNGRLWVVEMGDYPSGAGAARRPVAGGVGNVSKGAAPPGEDDERAGEQGGRVRVLEDADGDGVYDKATTFLQGLNFPTGICMWRDGVIITAAPDVIYAEDTDGDFKADVQKKLYTGFTEGNQQHRVNGLRWGLDGWLYLANGDSGGTIASYMADSGTVDIRGRDLRIQPDFGSIETLSGQTQFCRSRDDFGNWFGNNNSNPIWHYVQQEEYLKRNPHFGGAATRAEVSETPGAAPVFPTSRTLARFNDFDKSNRFTSACSTMIYRDHCLGKEFYGNAFTCEPVHNLVSRLVLERDGVSFKGRRADDERASEFFASSDNWCRPVMIRTGPDGALYIADMYRQVIEHPQWIPAEQQRKLDLYAGSDKGRIYRVVPVEECCGAVTVSAPPAKERPSPVARSSRPTLPGEGEAKEQNRFRKTSSPSSGRVARNERGGARIRADRDWFDVPAAQIATEQLIQRLASPNGWWRDTAQRLLLHRNIDNNDQRDAIAEIARTHENPAVRVQAMSTLFSVRNPEKKDAFISVLRTALQDSDADVRMHGIRLCESLPQLTPELAATLSRLVDDDSPVVRMQLAASLGNLNGESAGLLARLLSNDANNPHIVAAALSSLTKENVAQVLAKFGVPKEPTGVKIFGTLVRTSIAFNGREALSATGPIMNAVLKVADGLADPKTNRDPELWRRSTSLLRHWRNISGAVVQLHEQAEGRVTFATIGEQANTIVGDAKANVDLRVAVLEYISAAGSDDSAIISGLPKLLNAESPPILQQAAVRTLASFGQKEFPAQILAEWKGLSPATRAVTMEEILQRDSWITSALAAVKSGQLSAADFDAAARERFFNHKTKEIAATAREVLSVPDSDRDKVVKQYVEQLDGLTGTPAAGRAVFEKRCSVCHKLNNIGKSIGADLAALKNRSPEAMLTAILNPNKAVETKFLSYTAVTTAGRTHSGMLLNESATSITLMGTDGKQKTILRADLEELQCSNRSLMPDGLEKDLSAQNLADVIAFVQSARTKWKRFPGNSPRLISAAKDGTITLPASAAEVYGPALVFESQYGNLGFWASTDDYAVWTIDVPQSGHWTVELEYACDNGTAGNPIRFSTGSRLLTARVPGTGTWNDYKTWTVGQIDLGRGRRQLIVTAADKPSSHLIDLKSIRLIPPN